MMQDYHINIFYSEEHHGYIADIPDLGGCATLGHTPAEALSEVEKARNRWLEAAGAEGRPIPDPHYRPEVYLSKDVVVTNTLGEEAPSGEAQPSYEEVLAYIAKRISNHECILFLGSAIHVPPPEGLTQYSYPADKAPPIGVMLSKYLAEKSKYLAQDWWNLQRVAQHFESTKTRFRLVEEIEEAVHVGREPSPMVRMLADLEFPLVITTNYDQLYERALDQRAEEKGALAGTYDVSIYSANNIGQERLKTHDCSKKPDHQRPFILKIHGDVSRPESIVITDEDYIQFVLRMSDTKPYNPFGNNVLAHLMTWPTLFIGYSLMDYNLRLLFKTLRWRKDAANIPPTYSVDKKPDKLIRDVWENQRRYVSFIVLNLWDFIPKLHSLMPANGSVSPPLTGKTSVP